jgi:hypothetical protein
MRFNIPSFPTAQNTEEKMKKNKKAAIKRVFTAATLWGGVEGL